ncbi:MAG: hypothetical protein AAFR38_13460 [Planctomycetota bacterium]
MFVLNSRDMTVPPDVRSTFIRGRCEPVLLRTGHQLFKYSQHGLVNPKDGSITPWWSSVRPIHPDDTGLAEHERRAEGAGHSGADLARARSAVDKAWNEMTGMLRIALKVDAWAIAGRCSHQKYDSRNPSLDNVVWIGGAYQLWLPNLRREHVRG